MENLGLRHSFAMETHWLTTTSSHSELTHRVVTIGKYYKKECYVHHLEVRLDINIIYNL